MPQTAACVKFWALLHWTLIKTHLLTSGGPYRFAGDEVVVKTHLKSGKRGHVVLFSTDLNLTAVQIVDYSRLRFQIEFNFRDAKQHWGLEDFMNVSQCAVTHAVNFSFFMVNLSQIMLRSCRNQTPDLNLLDLKAHFRAQRYLSETIKMLPEIPPPVLVSRIYRPLARFGAIRTRLSHPLPSSLAKVLPNYP